MASPYTEVPQPPSSSGERLPYPCQTPLRRVTLENTKAARRAYLEEKIRRDEANGIAPFSFHTYPDLAVEVSDAFKTERARIENELLPEVWNGVMDLQRHNLRAVSAAVTDPKLQGGWRHYYYNDKKGDMLFFTRHRVENYHFAKSSFTLKNVSPLTVLTCMHSQSLPQRQKYSKHIAEYCILERNPVIYEKYFSEHDKMHELRKRAAKQDPQYLNHLQERAKTHGSSTSGGRWQSGLFFEDDEDADSPARPVEQLFNDNELLPEMALQGERDWYIEYNRFYAPSPAAHRDITMLIEKKYDIKENCYYVYGCSVDFANFAEHDEVAKVQYKKANHGKDMYVIDGIIMFCWQLLPVGTDTVCTYTNVMNPSGWAPPAIVSWFKGEVIKELTTARRLLYAETAIRSPFGKRLAAMLLEGKTTSTDATESGTNEEEELLANSSFCNANSTSYDPAVVAGLILVQREAAAAARSSGTSASKAAETTMRDIEAFREQLRTRVAAERAGFLRRPAPGWFWRFFTSSAYTQDTAAAGGEEDGDGDDADIDGEHAPPANVDAATLEQQLLAVAATAACGIERQVYEAAQAEGVAPLQRMTEEDRRAYERGEQLTAKEHSNDDASTCHETEEGMDQLLVFTGHEGPAHASVSPTARNADDGMKLPAVKASSVSGSYGAEIASSGPSEDLPSVNAEEEEPLPEPSEQPPPFVSPSSASV